MAEVDGPLGDIRVLEIADEKGAHCGKLLAANGASVIKIEPPWGDPSRHYGPFVHDRPDAEQSLHFWHYNANKRGLTLDLRTTEGGAILRQLVAGADMIVDATPVDFLQQHGLHYERLRDINPRLLMASITPFGQSGPWRHYRTSDLVHLALGGVMAICGYDPDESGQYDTPPIAPQMWHAYHIASHYAFIGLLGALCYRDRTDVGQYIDVSIHEACSSNTEFSLPFFMYNEMPVQRLTNRHAYPYVSQPVSHRARDGRYVWAGITPDAPTMRKAARFMVEVGILGTDELARFAEDAWANGFEARELITRAVRDYVAAHTAEEVYRAAQAHDLAWGAVRFPEDNLHDAQFRARGGFGDIAHAGLGPLPYTTAPWLAEKTPWHLRHRAPHLGEHNVEIYCGELGMAPHRLAELRAAGAI
jgi:crotonobetainyl-CoA:carnitine CoA-transferase CaiB-like acyl-CoA transferase